MEKNMDIINILEELLKFQENNDCKAFFTTENITNTLRNKTADLHEIFQNKNKEEINLIIKNEKDQIQEKLAEIIIYSFYLCHNLDITYDNMEVAMYSKVLKETTNRYLKVQGESPQNMPNSKVIKFKRD
jgi:NTP pyrophosphatase (non-canonical NTP hydrolase)